MCQCLMCLFIHFNIMSEKTSDVLCMHTIILANLYPLFYYAIIDHIMQYQKGLK